jgi:two-component system cell cycle sensor histidine kinase/response regulator CckA
LVVDDEPAVRALVTLVLQRDGFATLEAEDGEQGLTLVGQLGPRVHLLVSDVQMPKVNGYTLARDARAQRPDLAIVLMSGYTDLEPSAFAFITKPFTPTALRDIVANVMHARAMAAGSD